MDENMMAEMPKLISGEAADAMNYANLALAHRADHPDLADMFMKLSGEELRHMQMIADKMTVMVQKLHDQYHGA